GPPAVIENIPCANHWGAVVIAEVAKLKQLAFHGRVPIRLRRASNRWTVAQMDVRDEEGADFVLRRDRLQRGQRPCVAFSNLLWACRAARSVAHNVSWAVWIFLSSVWRRWMVPSRSSKARARVSRGAVLGGMSLLALAYRSAWPRSCCRRAASRSFFCSWSRRASRRSNAASKELTQTNS